ncbi:MAG: histidine ammonia-lyase, partial [Candidatus Dormiibacterota bacterium]
LRRPLEPSPATAAVRDLLRTRVPGAGPDRVVAPDLAAAEELIRSGAVVEAAESVTGPLR